MANIVSAKAKAPTKTERLRVNLSKANAKAAKALPNIDRAKMINELVVKSAGADGAARVFAHWMNAQFAEPMKAYRCHWSAFSLANCRTDNEKSILKRIEELRKQVQEIAIEKGLAGINKPWSDMTRISKELFLGGAPREKTQKPLEQRQLEMLQKLYKQGMKEERPTNEELAVNDTIGRLLIEYFKVDLSKLG